MEQEGHEDAENEGMISKQAQLRASGVIIFSRSPETAY